MSIFKVSKRMVGPTLAKGGNDDSITTMDVGENCSGGYVNGGLGGACNMGPFEVSFSCSEPGNCNIGVRASRSSNC